MLRIRAGQLDPDPAPFQQSHMLHIPRLDSQPWYEAQNFPWRDQILEIVPQVRAELDVLLDRGLSQPYVSGYNPDLSAHSKAGESVVERAFSTWPARAEDWSVFLLYRHGLWF
jgi:hypothetical protein